MDNEGDPVIDSQNISTCDPTNGESEPIRTDSFMSFGESEKRKIH